MKPAPFEYLSATSVAEAVGFLAEHGPDARLLAGGQSLVRLMNARMATPRVVIDINGLTSLDRITGDDTEVTIGAMTRQRTSESSPTVRAHIPVFAEAGRHVAHVSVRERGTVVGSLAFADPSAELPAAMQVLDGRVVAMGPDGERVIPADDFFTGPFQTSLSPTEMVTEVRIPCLPAGSTGSAFLEVSRRQGELPVCGVAAVLCLSAAGQVTDARIALCGVDQRPVRARQAERRLTGQTPAADLITDAADLAVEGLNPRADCHGSADFRRHLARVLTGRALHRALTRAQASQEDLNA